MKNKSGRLNTGLACLCASMLLVSGCSATGYNAPYPNTRGTPQGYSLGGGNNISGGMGGTNWGAITGRNQSTTQIQPAQIGFDGQKANYIKRQLGNMGGIQKINSVVYGNTALIGYSPTDRAGDATAVKNNIINRVKQMDGSIKNVIVTDSADLSSRIARLSNDVRSGRPMNELSGRFNQLMKSMTPGVR